jgi:hypothetical protein
MWSSEQIYAAEQPRWAEQQAEGSSSGRRRTAGRAVHRPGHPCRGTHATSDQRRADWMGAILHRTLTRP